MLVLSRKPGERIHIGNSITIEVRRVAGNRVTLALEAPRDVRILRGELEGPAHEFARPAGQTNGHAAPPIVTHRVHVIEGLPTGMLDGHVAI